MCRRDVGRGGEGEGRNGGEEGEEEEGEEEGGREGGRGELSVKMILLYKCGRLSEGVWPNEWKWVWLIGNIPPSPVDVGVVSCCGHLRTVGYGPTLVSPLLGRGRGEEREGGGERGREGEREGGEEREGGRGREGGREGGEEGV